MITASKAKQLLSIGDTVCTTNGRSIIPATIRNIKHDHLDTDVDILFYEDHGVLWWLTEKVAKEHLTNG